MKVAIIGGAGRMGAWFAKYFCEKGHSVRIFDVRRKDVREVARQLGVEVADDTSRAVEDSNSILVSVPMEATPKVLRELAPLLRGNVILIEIASLKQGTQRVLRQIARKGIRTISLHPLFGPGANDLVRKKIALIPISDEKRELEVARQLFPEANLLPVDAHEHDRIMAIVLSLTHFVNLAYASALAGEEVGILKKFGGPSFLTQLTLAQSVLSEDTSNYFSIQVLNMHTRAVLRKLTKAIKNLEGLVQNGDRAGFSRVFLKCRTWLYTDPKAPRAYEKMYRILNVIEG